MIQLTVLSKDNQSALYAAPRLRVFNPRRISIVGGHGNNTVIQVRDDRGAHVYVVGEEPAQVMSLINGATDVKFGTTQQLSANGTTQASGTLITSFMARVTTASVGNDSVTLKKATILDITYTVVNATAVPIKVWPAVGDAINQQAVNTSLTIQPGDNAIFIVVKIS